MSTNASPIGGNLEGRVALVTGGTRGIGAAISLMLAQQGATVAANFGGNVERAEQFLEDLKARGGGDPSQYSIYQGNVGDGDECRRTVAEVVERHGAIDILVNNAGITRDNIFPKITDDDWKNVIDVDLSGVFYMSQAVLPSMIERGTGRVINVSSLSGVIGNIGQANYAAAKSGIFGLTKTLARESCFQLTRNGKIENNPIGVTVNAVAPGYIGTEMVRSVPEKLMERITSQIPTRRIGEPEEVARVVHFLAADESGFITGQVWGINGGQDM